MAHEHSLRARFYAFRPSDRDALLKAFESAEEKVNAIGALHDYIIKWENADWLEAYSIERIGKWLGRKLSPETIDEIKHWALETKSDARDALLEGIRKSLAQLEPA